MKFEQENLYSFRPTNEQLKKIKRELGELCFINGHHIIVPLEFREDSERQFIANELQIEADDLPPTGYLMLWT